MSERRLFGGGLLGRVLLPAARDRVGLDGRIVDAVRPLVERSLRFWFRQEVDGVDRVPGGAALVVGNHNAGITFLEPFGMAARWYRERGVGEPLCFLVHDAVLAVPAVGAFLWRVGCVRASRDNALGVLRDGGKVVVFPGGDVEAWRPYRDRHRVDLAGRKGFVRLALQAQVPIVPMLSVGGHETLFVLARGRRLARALGLKRLLRTDSFPVSVALPWGLVIGPAFHLPLPAKCRVRFLDPIPTDTWPAAAARDESVVQKLYDRVEQALQQGMDEQAAQRRLPVLG